MHPSQLNIDRQLGQRVAALLKEQESELRQGWQESLKQHATFAKHDVIALLSDELKKGQDLLAILIRLLSEDSSAESKDLTLLLNKIRTRAYSISDFFYELTSFDDAIENVLMDSTIFSSDEILAYMKVVKTKLTSIFEIILSETSEVFEYMTERGNIGFCQLDPTGRITYANHEIQTIFGLSTNYHGQSFIDLFHGEEKEHVINSISAKIDSATGTRELCVQRKNKSCLTVWAGIQPMVLGGKQLGSYALLMDITPIEERTNHIYENTEMGIVKVNNAQVLTYANAAAKNILGVDNIHNLSAEDFLADKDSLSNFRQQLEKRRHDKSSTYKIKVKRISDSKLIPVRVTGTPIIDTQGNQIGSIGMIQDLEIETVIRNLHEYISTIDDRNKMLTKVAQKVNELIPFDMFVVTQYSNEGRFARPIFTYPSDAQSWSKRYFHLSEAMIDWMCKSDLISVEDDFEEFINQEEWRDLKDDPNVQAMITNDMLSFIRVSILTENKLTASVAIFKKGRSQYQKDLKHIVSQLPLDKATLMALHYDEKQDLSFRLNLVKDIVNSKSFDEISATLVEKLAKQYEWSHVSLFRVDSLNKQIILEKQIAVSDDAISLDENYTQPINKGFLGNVVMTKEYMKIDDVLSPEYEDLYIEGSTETRSELCYPIKTPEDEEVKWILNLEDKYVNAYSDDEVKSLEAVLDEVAIVFKRLEQHHFYSACFTSTSDAVIMADRSLRIQNSNPAAKVILGFYNNETLNGKCLLSFTEDEQRLRELFSAPSVSNIEIKMTRRDGQPIRVLISSTELPNGHGNHILMAKDITDVKRMEELAFMGKMSYEVASQTQSPLSLTLSWLKRLRDGRVSQDQYSETISKSMTQLRKVQMGIDRLMMYDIETSLVPKNMIQLNLSNEVKRVLSDFPLRECEKINIGQVDDTAYISGDPFQFRFIIESIFSYLLRFLPEENKINIKFDVHDNHVTLTFSGFKIPAQQMRRDSDNFVARVQTDLALGTPIIKSFCRNHGGEFTVNELENNQILFTVTMPVSEKSALMAG